MYNMSSDYSYWNDTSVAHMFIRLMIKKNHPYNENSLTLDEFNADYKTLKDYIDWKKQNNINSLSLYNFTIESMTYFLDLIKYDTDNTDELRKIWHTDICGIK